MASTGPTAVAKAKPFWTRPRMIAAAIGVGIVVLLAYAYDISDWFDDERPPIIVNNGGSVRFTLDWHIKGRGKWKRLSPGIGSVYQHDHVNARPVRIEVTPRKYARCVDGNGASAKPPFDGTRVDITYGDGSRISESAWLIVGPASLTANVPSTLPELSSNEDALTVHDNNGAVWIRSMQVGSYTCTFDSDKGSIKIKQKHLIQ